MKPPLKAAHKTPLASLSRLVVLVVLPAAERLARAASLNFVNRSKSLRAFPQEETTPSLQGGLCSAPPARAAHTTKAAMNGRAWDSWL